MPVLVSAVTVVVRELQFCDGFPYPWGQVFKVAAIAVKSLHQKSVGILAVYRKSVSVQAQKDIGREKGHALVCTVFTQPRFGRAVSGWMRFMQHLSTDLYPGCGDNYSTRSDRRNGIGLVLCSAL
jgi:hypothetical protein